MIDFPLINAIGKARIIIRRAVGNAAALIMGWMIVLSCAQLTARWVFNDSIDGADLMLRQMVLIISLLGGVLATTDDRHIRIDLADNFLTGRWKVGIRKGIRLCASVITGYLAWVSMIFIQSERQAEVVLRGLFFGIDITQWYIELLIPVCLILMSLLFMESGLTSVTDSKILEEK